VEVSFSTSESFKPRSRKLFSYMLHKDNRLNNLTYLLIFLKLKNKLEFTAYTKKGSTSGQFKRTYKWAAFISLSSKKQELHFPEERPG